MIQDTASYSSKKLLFIIAVLSVSFLGALLLPAPLMAKKMFFIFLFAAFFWGFEIVPLYATALIVVLFEIFLLALPGQSGLDFTLFLKPFANPVIFIFMGGFVLARALHENKLDQILVQPLIRQSQGDAFRLLAGLMLATGLLSMWMSNTATTALMLAMLQPLLVSLKDETSFKKALVLGIAFAANIGGIATPVGTPPNAIALAFLAEKGIHFSFWEWTKVGAPLSLFLLAAMSFFLYRLFCPRQPQLKHVLLIKSDFPPLNVKNKMVLGICFLTVFFWLTSSWHHVPDAVVALGGVGLLAILGLIGRQDINQIHWDILILVWGGLALGEGMERSGLAAWIVSHPLLSGGQGIAVLGFLGIVTVLLSTFMSNAAALALMLPMALSLPQVQPVAAAFLLALASSFDVALPISTPPMAMAYSTRQIEVKDMLKAGLPFTVFANVLVFTVVFLFLKK